MIREIKFRVFDSHLKVMHNNRHLYHEFVRELSNERYKVMQYVGTKDKNGFDIYDGHIVLIRLPLGGFWGNVKTEKIAKIRYEPELCGYIAEWEYSKNQHHIQLNCDLDIEILGDIYQTPELLK